MICNVSCVCDNLFYDKFAAERNRAREAIADTISEETGQVAELQSSLDREQILSRERFDINQCSYIDNAIYMFQSVDYHYVSL